MIRKSLIALIAAMLPLVSCVKEEQKTEILLNLEQVSLTEGETLQLTVAVSASSSTSSIEWSSLNEKVAVVKDGLVTAVNPGETWIYASLGDVKEGCLVRVGELVVMHRIYLCRLVVPTIHHILVLGVVVVEEDVTIKFCPLASTPPIRVVHRKDLGRGYARLTVYRECRGGIRTICRTRHRDTLVG